MADLVIMVPPAILEMEGLDCYAVVDTTKKVQGIGPPGLSQGDTGRAEVSNLVLGGGGGATVTIDGKKQKVTGVGNSHIEFIADLSASGEVGEVEVATDDGNFPNELLDGPIGGLSADMFTYDGGSFGSMVGDQYRWACSSTTNWLQINASVAAYRRLKLTISTGSSTTGNYYVRTDTNDTGDYERPVITAGESKRLIECEVQDEAIKFYHAGGVAEYLYIDEIYVGYQSPEAWINVGDYLVVCVNVMGCGSSTDGLACGGGILETTSIYDYTTTFDGTTYTDTGHSLPGNTSANALVGTPTAALQPGGANGVSTSHSDSYDGTAWTGETALPTGCISGSGCGTDTDCFVTGTTPNYEWNGTSWNSAAAFPGTNWWGEKMVGSTSAANVVGSNSSEHYSYDGTSWTAEPDSIVAKDGYETAQFISAAGVGDDFLAWGGGRTYVVFSGKTAHYGGTAWVLKQDHPMDVGGGCGFGTESESVVSVAGATGYNNSEKSQKVSWVYSEPDPELL